MQIRRRTSKIETCYKCEAVATGREHVPALGFFPTVEDSPGGANLRDNLTTVPACALHNTKKSKEDEFVRFVICAAPKVNDVGLAVIRGPILRAIRERPMMGLSILGHAFQAWTYDFDAKQYRRTGLATIDENRIYPHFELFGSALYLHHFKAKWLREVRAFPDFFEFNGSAASQSVRGDWRDALRVFDAAFRSQPWPRHGNNQAAFYYQVIHDDESGRTIIKATFYEGPSIYLSFGLTGESIESVSP